MSVPVMYPAKRRKLDESSSTLSKPFRSPLRVDLNTRTCHIYHNEQTQPGQRVKVPNHKAGLHSNETNAEHISPHPSSGVQAPSSLLSSSPYGSARDLEYISLQKQHSALVLQLSQLRQALDSAQQALRIQSSEKDVELGILIQKWRLVSREAAEELFAGAKDRVNRMGGIGAWQERNQARTQRWDEDERVNQDDLTEAQKDLIAEQKEEIEAEKRKYGNEKVEEVVGGKDDEPFTMDVMLKSLNIELELIGYDKQSQRWVE